ncbi:hypothetical protein G7Y89_g13827 [Cudoniella acicularis]|uniref:NACHT domain-containing protein n=1 Tax=Cudoniella acicularis TaxID=354080 RepID=A0A8H4VVP4_9HELO|nr:hypothetical protein G7Y89_g13827 [Cudoniella acicularis]
MVLHFSYIHLLHSSNDAVSDPATVIGTLSAVVALAQTCADYISKFKDAHKDALDLLAEVIAVGHVLQSLRAHLAEQAEQAGKTGKNPYTRTSVLFIALNGCQKRLREIKDVVEPLVLRNNRLRVFLSRLKWPMKREDAHDAVVALHRYAQIFHFAVHLDGLRAISLSQHDSLQQIQSRLDGLQKHQEAFSDAKTAAEIQEALNAVKSLPEMSAVLVKLTSQVTQLAIDREMGKVLELIPSLPYQDRHQNLQLKRMEGVGQWILEMPDFIKWRNRETRSGVLWCKGALGVGKTYIMSVIVDYLREFASRDRILYFYFDYRRQSDQTPLKILQTLLRQLLSTFPRLPPGIPELLPEAVRRGGLPGWAKLLAILVELCKKSKNVFIVFDALDECDQHANRGPVIELLKALIKSDARLLVASRPYPPDVEALLRDHSTIPVEASDSDIRAYLLNEIARSPTASKIIDAELREEIIKSVVSKSQGMFLLPSMQINAILGQTNRGQVIEALKVLPTGLAENIGFTVERIKSQHPQSRAQATLAMKVLLWLSHAKRPLKVSELRHAIAIKPEEMRMEDLTDPYFFVHCCFGLAVIDKETSIIRLVHFSVNEYLQEHHSKLFSNADDELTLSCLSYMVIYQSGIHASASVLLKTQQEVQLFCSRRRVFQAWATLLDIDVTTKKTTDELEAQYVNVGSSVLHVAAVYGLNYLMEEHLRKDLTINTTDIGDATPLMLAAACGHTDILQVLLAQPHIDVHCLDKEQHTVLWYAVYRGQVQCVQILLSSGFDMDINRGKPFSLASQRVWRKAHYGEIMSLLLSQSELDPNCEYGEASDPPWFYLAIYWEFDLLRRLVRRPNFDPWRWTPPVKLWERFTKFMRDTDYDYFLEGESSNKKAANLPAIFRLLDADERFCLPKFYMLYLMWPFVYYAFGKDIPYQDEGHTYRYLINWMFIWDDTKWTWRGILRRSLEANRLSFRTTDSKNRGFIHFLALDGQEEYLKVILQQGVAIDSKDNLGRTPLHYAAIKGHKGACDILIDVGASPHSVDNDGQTVLHLACSSGKLEVITRLIELGVDIHAKDRYGSTALHFASKFPKVAPIKELVLWGLDINASDNIGATPLYEAANRSTCTASFTLLDMGADPNICGMAGTPLSNAIFKGIKALVDRLVLVTDLDIPDCVGRTSRSQLPFLFEDHRLSETGQGNTEPAISVQRDVVLSYFRKRLKAMLDGDDYIRTKLCYGAALILQELGDEVSAQVMLEHRISPFSNVNTIYWPKFGTCSSYKWIVLCESCKELGSADKDKGAVNAEGETFEEFLTSLSRKYNEENFKVIELEDGGETTEVGNITQHS